MEIENRLSNLEDKINKFKEQTAHIGTNRRYPDEIKNEILDIIGLGYISQHKICKRLNLSNGMLHSWKLSKNKIKAKNNLFIEPKVIKEFYSDHKKYYGQNELQNPITLTVHSNNYKYEIQGLDVNSIKYLISTFKEN